MKSLLKRYSKNINTIYNPNAFHPKSYLLTVCYNNFCSYTKDDLKELRQISGSPLKEWYLFISILYYMLFQY